MRKHRGLTLVKFLVVLSIVAIMVRLLIPAVPYAQKAANVTVGKKLDQPNLAIRRYA